MKYSILTFLFFASSNIYAQNLVPNPSFEDILSCPFGLGDLTPIVGWESFGNSPDCFHSCSSMTINIPNSDFGYQYAHTGNAMTGIISYVWELDPGWPNYREYLGAQLLSPLVVGQKYFVSFFINCAGYIPGGQHIGANKIGARFSTFQYDDTQPTIPDNVSHIYTETIVTDTVQWYQVQGSFVADSSYEYIVIGNFFDHLQTDTIIFGGDPFGGSAAYYYIDDVCVSTDSAYCITTTDIKHNAISSQYSIYPNPASGFVNIKSSLIINSIEIYNSLGALVYLEKGVNGKHNTVDTNYLPKGIYTVRISNNVNQQVLKLAIN